MGEGRKHKASLKILKGNPKKDPNLGLPKRIAKTKFKKKPPKHLSDRAKKIWKEFVARVGEQDAFTAADESFVERYCEFKAQWENWRDHVENNGISVEDIVTTRFGESISTKESPEYRAYKNGINVLMRMETELGLTPRSRMRQGIEPGGEEEDDVLLSFLKRN